MESNAKKIKAFISSIIKQREFLLKEDKSQKNKLEMVNSIEFLNMMLDANQFSTDRLMAKFFFNHLGKIYNLLPGQESKDHEARLKEFREIENICKEIINQNL